MITGYNTDIEYKGVTYHVQTEDKGVSTPLILSLVYDGGTILASKRSAYEDLLLPAFDEKSLSERLQKQHKLICAAVRAGRIEELKRMTTKEASLKRIESAAAKEAKSPSEKKQAAPLLLEDEPIIEAVAVIEDEPILLSAEAVEIIEDVAEPARAKLKIELPRDVTFKGGERKILNIKVLAGSAKNGINGARLLIKVVGTMFRPLIFHAQADASGAATVNLEIPDFKGGRAALLIRAMSGGEETEMRCVIQPS
ncbi:MAG: hypothetical protein H0U87_05270 [Acidobacteria bacterium]|nr:hypothetical protein [Acidobacteriota bacterium]